MFSKFARILSYVLGTSVAFSIALLAVIIWGLSGPLFQYSEVWQLVINTATTIITFLMVFLLQHTQNIDTISIQLKLDEIIRAMEGTHNELLKIEELPEDQLQELLKRYEDLSKKVKTQMNKGKDDVGVVDIEK